LLAFKLPRQVLLVSASLSEQTYWRQNEKQKQSEWENDTHQIEKKKIDERRDYTLSKNLPWSAYSPVKGLYRGILEDVLSVASYELIKRGIHLIKESICTAWECLGNHFQIGSTWSAVLTFKWIIYTASWAIHS
jgi:hypothetical protein